MFNIIIREEVIYMQIILASQSPRRKELMDLMGLDYKVIVSNADETFEKVYL